MDNAKQVRTVKSYLTGLPSLFALLALATFLPGCSNTSTPLETGAEVSEMQQLSGFVGYRERILLPPSAKVRVTLEDVSRMDVAATLIAETRFEGKGAPPYPFELKYDPGVITEKGRYGLRATIHVDDQLVFTSDQFIPAFDPARTEPVLIELRRMRR